VYQRDEGLVGLVVLGVLVGQVEQSVVDALHLFVLEAMGLLQPVDKLAAQFG